MNRTREPENYSRFPWTVCMARIPCQGKMLWPRMCCFQARCLRWRAVSDFKKTPARFVGEMYRQDPLISQMLPQSPTKDVTLYTLYMCLWMFFLRWWTLTTFFFYFKLYLEKETWENRAVTRDSEPAKQMQNVSKFPALKGCAHKKTGWQFQMGGGSVKMRAKMGVFFFTIRKDWWICGLWRER